MEVVTEEFAGPAVHGAVQGRPDDVRCFRFLDECIADSRLTRSCSFFAICGFVFFQIIRFLPYEGALCDDILYFTVDLDESGAEGVVAVVDGFKGAAYEGWLDISCELEDDLQQPCAGLLVLGEEVSGCSDGGVDV